jgi:2-oxoglutarate ferredoxin oxidoreductase subunit beta
MTAGPITYQPAQPIWCAGCGHFAVLNALRAVIRDLELSPHNLMVLAGIGCSGTIQNYLGAYGYHALHGRVLPTATGVALANPDLTVVAVGGDGDGYAIGVGHLVHTFRRNASFAYLLMNNETYGLTKGQPSPGRFLSNGARESALMGPMLGLSIPSTSFVARGYSGWFDQLVRLTREALDHARSGRGFAFLEVISPCVAYADTYAQWDEVLVDVDADPAYDPSDRIAAFATATRMAAEGRLPAGVLFRAVDVHPASRPAPARANLDARNPKYRAILDRYSVHAQAEQPAPDGTSDADDVRTTLELINSSRLPGQPPARESDLRTDLAVPGAVLAVTRDANARGIACYVSSEGGPNLCWLCAPEDRALVRRTIEQALGPGGGGCTSAFNLPTAVGWGIPGLSVGRRPETHTVLVELGFQPCRQWLYMRGKPAFRAPHVADLVKETRPNHWVLIVLHNDEPVAEAKVELGAGGKGIVRWIAVAEAFRGRGLGRALFDHATNLLGSKGANDVVLFVDDEVPGGKHAAALNLYTGAGFTVTDHLVGYERVARGR